MNDKHIDELIDRALREEQELPEGLPERLEQYIDRLADGDRQKQAKQVKMRALYWLTGVAAALLLGIAIFFRTENTSMQPPTVADTFADPQEAAVAAQEALAFLSTQFNKGVDQAVEAKQDVERVNEIVNKQLK